MERLHVGLNQLLVGVLTVAVVLAAAGVLYLTFVPQQTTDPYTEFYILGPDGEATGYPTNLSTGQQGAVIIGITNQEYERTTYTVLAVADNETLASREVTVPRDETWEQELSFTFTEPGRVKIQFLLYRGGQNPTADPAYRSLRLWVNVTA